MDVFALWLYGHYFASGFYVALWEFLGSFRSFHIFFNVVYELGGLSIGVSTCRILYLAVGQNRAPLKNQLVKGKI